MRVLAFIAELYEGTALMSRDRFGFVQLVALQLVALLLDCLTILLLFWAVGVWPHFSVVLLGYSLAYFFSTISSLPGGGGTFEALMVVTMTNLGIEAAIALSVTLLYRLLAFWLPLPDLVGDLPPRSQSPRCAAQSARGRARHAARLTHSPARSSPYAPRSRDCGTGARHMRPKWLQNDATKVA